MGNEHVRTLPRTRRYGASFEERLTKTTGYLSPLRRQRTPNTLIHRGSPDLTVAGKACAVIHFGRPGG